MRVVVTGGSGFIGSHLVRRLAAAGHTVQVLDPNEGIGHAELGAPGVTRHRGSVSDPAAVDAAVAGQDVVFHLASPFGNILLPDREYDDVEVRGTRLVLEAAQRHRVRRVVHCSTQGVHGIIRNGIGDEDSPIAPRDHYCASKSAGELVCREFVEKGLDVVIVRPTSVYGPGDTRGWLSLYRMVSRGRFVMIGSGRTLNHPVYVDDLVDLFVRAAEAPAARGRVYIGGGDKAVTLTELVRAVAASLGTEVDIIRFPSYSVAWLGAAAVEFTCRPLGIKPPVFRRRLSWYRTNRAFRIDRARTELGYTPQVSLEEGLARTSDWYRAHGYL